MSENLRRYTKALYALDAVARRVPAEAWDSPSCCSKWTARQVAGHAAWVVLSVGAATGAFPAPARRDEAETAGDDPAATIAAAVDRTLEALDHQGALQHVADTPFGTMAIDDFIGTLWVDPLTHTWDIADAAGIPHGIDEATAAAAHRTLAPISDMLRASGRFDPPLESDGDAVDRFIAFTGRASVRA